MGIYDYNVCKPWFYVHGICIHCTTDKTLTSQMQHSQSVKHDIRISKDIYCKTITSKLKGTETTRRTPLKTERDFRCSGRVSKSCIVNNNRRVMMKPASHKTQHENKTQLRTK